MERVVSAIVLAAAITLVGFAQSPSRDSSARKSESTGTITGRVVAADSGEVIRRARVSVNPISSTAPAGPIQSILTNPRRLTRWIRPNPSGEFSVDELLPGAYMVAALDDVDDALWLNADYLAQLRPRATRVELHAGETTTVVLNRLAER